MNENINKAVALITHLIVLNNAGGTARALVAEGYERKTYIDDCELELILLRAYLADKQKYFAILQNIEWHYGETRTNKAEYKQQLMAITGTQDAPDNKGFWWKRLITDLMKQS